MKTTKKHPKLILDKVNQHGENVENFNSIMTVVLTFVLFNYM